MTLPLLWFMQSCDINGKYRCKYFVKITSSLLKKDIQAFDVNKIILLKQLNRLNYSSFFQHDLETDIVFVVYLLFGTSDYFRVHL